MSLTKAALLDKIAPRTATVTVDGIGEVCLRSCPQLQFSQRWVSYTDTMTGEIIPEERAKAAIHEIIDQVLTKPGEPMFTDEDFDELAATDSEKLAPLTDAIRRFNDIEKKVTSGSDGT